MTMKLICVSISYEAIVAFFEHTNKQTTDQANKQTNKRKINLLYSQVLRLFHIKRSSCCTLNEILPNSLIFVSAGLVHQPRGNISLQMPYKRLIHDTNKAKGRTNKFMPCARVNHAIMTQQIAFTGDC